jgi:hypothetical protein
MEFLKLLGIIAAGGDLLSQFAIEKRTLRTYDPVRTARFCLVISCWVVSSSVVFRMYFISYTGTGLVSISQIAGTNSW